MHIDRECIRRAVEAELEAVSDERVAARIRGLLVEPTFVMRTYEFSTPKSEHPCCIVLADPARNRGVAYAATGFGPQRPWGVIHLTGNKPEDTSMLLDEAWYYSCLEAWLSEFTPTDLPIWRVSRRAAGVVEFLSDRGPWRERWDQVKLLREENDPRPYHEVDTDVFPRKLRGGWIVKY